MLNSQNDLMAEPLEASNDQDLILAVQEGSLQALGVIYDRHRRLVYRTAMAICNDSEAAADLLQDVFLRLFRFARRIDPQRPLEPWLYRVTTNLAYSWVKRRHRWMHSLEEIAERMNTGRKYSPLYLAELDEESQRIHQALARLPLPQRVVVVLYYINDLSLREIAEIVKIPEGTVKSRLHYGRLALRQYLGLDNPSLPELGYEFT